MCFFFTDYQIVNGEENKPATDDDASLETPRSIDTNKDCNGIIDTNKDGNRNIYMDKTGHDVSGSIDSDDSVNRISIDADTRKLPKVNATEDEEFAYLSEEALLEKMSKVVDIKPCQVVPFSAEADSKVIMKEFCRSGQNIRQEFKPFNCDSSKSDIETARKWIAKQDRIVEDKLRECDEAYAKVAAEGNALQKREKALVNRENNALERRENALVNRANNALERREDESPMRSDDSGVCRDDIQVDNDPLSKSIDRKETIKKDDNDADFAYHMNAMKRQGVKNKKDLKSFENKKRHREKNDYENSKQAMNDGYESDQECSQTESGGMWRGENRDSCKHRQQYSHHNRDLHSKFYQNDQDGYESDEEEGDESRNDDSCCDSSHNHHHEKYSGNYSHGKYPENSHHDHSRFFDTDYSTPHHFSGNKISNQDREMRERAIAWYQSTRTHSKHQEREQNSRERGGSCCDRGVHSHERGGNSDDLRGVHSHKRGRDSYDKRGVHSHGRNLNSYDERGCNCHECCNPWQQSQTTRGYWPAHPTPYTSGACTCEMYQRMLSRYTEDTRRLQSWCTRNFPH